VDAKLPEHVHLVGSIGLDSAQDVFRVFWRRLRSVPDAEPGPRRLWVSLQYPLPHSSPFLRPLISGRKASLESNPILLFDRACTPWCVASARRCCR
jgi:hypothetical protein